MSDKLIQFDRAKNKTDAYKDIKGLNRAMQNMADGRGLSLGDKGREGLIQFTLTPCISGCNYGHVKYDTPLHIDKHSWNELWH